MSRARFQRNAALKLAAAICALAAIFTAAFPAQAADARSKPKVRAITAFVRLDPAHYQEEIQDTLKFLRQAKTAFEKSGYEVETIRITTQPFPEYTRGMTDEQVLAFFRDYDALAVKEGFDAAIGPAMMSDADDPHEAELLAKIIAGSKTLEGSVFIAGEDGIHWKSIHAAAGVIKYLEANTLHSQGNFSFHGGVAGSFWHAILSSVLFHWRRKAIRDRPAVRKRGERSFRFDKIPKRG